MKKPYAWIISIFVLVTILGILIPVIINEIYKSNSGDISVWNAADLLSYCGALIGAVGTIFLGLLSYKQNIDLKKANDAFEKANITLASNDLMLNAYPRIEFELITITDDNSINFFFSDKGKFRPNIINIISCEMILPDNGRLGLLTDQKCSGIFRDTEKHSGYFQFQIDQGKEKPLNSIPINNYISNIGPEMNLVLMITFIIYNNFGVANRSIIKFTAQRTDAKGFVKKMNFLVEERIYMSGTES